MPCPTITLDDPNLDSVALTELYGLAGFGGISRDEHTAQIVDAITHTKYRCQGITIKNMRTLLDSAKAQPFGQAPIDGSGYIDLYERFGSTTADPTRTDSCTGRAAQMRRTARAVNRLPGAGTKSTRSTAYTASSMFGTCVTK